MKETKYITIGTPIISNDIFRNILRPLDNFSLKPTGGLWASKFNLPYGKICPWFDYLLDARGIARSISEYRDLTKATIFTLKENANILTINTSNQILELSKKYPSYYQSLNYIYEITERNTIFDYEVLSKAYDGIYINYENIYREIKSEVFDSWSTDTLLLFNLNCIKEYQSTNNNLKKMIKVVLDNCNKEKSKNVYLTINPRNEKSKNALTHIGFYNAEGKNYKISYNDFEKRVTMNNVKY